MENVKKKEETEVKRAVEKKEKVIPDSDILKAWKEQVTSLRSQTFETLDDAINGLVTTVTESLKMSDRQSEETRAFLELLIETDPGFQEQISKMLNIKNKS